MEEELSTTALPWCWVIETLARSQRVGAAILYELLAGAPLLSGKSGQEAREAVALRCLEEFFGSSSGLIDEHPTSKPSKARFNSSDSCEDVLERILHESAGCDLRKDSSYELKCEVRSFIKLKKASLPRCSLELLKSVIIEGSHPLTESFKEIKEHALPSSDGADQESTLSALNEYGHRDQAMPAEESGVSSEKGNNDQPELASSPNGNSPYSKGGAIDEVQEAGNIMNSMDNLEPPTKRLKLSKQDGVLPQQQPLVTCDDTEASNAAEDGKNHQSLKKSREVSGKFIGENSDELRKCHVRSDNQPPTSHDNDVHRHGETDLTKKMLDFLSSQSMLASDSPSLTETEVNLCMKCNKGGELLICGVNTCPLAFHESCLGCSASFDDQGKFYCPFCAYSCAISEYVRAKEKVSLARKELSLFVGGRISCPAKTDSVRASGDDVNQQNQNDQIDKTTEPNSGIGVVMKVGNRQLRTSKGKQREVSALKASVIDNASLRDLPSKERLVAETSGQRAWDVTAHGRDDHKTDGGKLSHGDGQITDTSLKNFNRRRKKESARHQATELHEDVDSDSIVDFDGLSEDDKNKANMSVLSPKPLREVPIAGSYREVPVAKGSRRKKVPWTAEEEAMLKNGIERFAKGDNVAVPWKSILEFGVSVFHKGRTPIDLKDKWRNIMRGSPKVK